MRLRKPTAVLVVLLVLALVVPTNAAVTEDRPWEDRGIVLSPHAGPNGRYADLDAQGNLSIDLDGEAMNRKAVTVIDDVFNVSNDGEESLRVWITHDAPDRVRFHGRSGSIQGAGNATVVAPEESVPVGLTIDSEGISSDTQLLDEFRLHASPADEAETETEAPDDDGEGGSGGGDDDEEQAPTPTPDGTETVVDVGEVRIEFEEDLEPGETVTVDRRDRLPPDPGTGIRADISRTSQEVPNSAAVRETLQALGADSVVTEGEPVRLSASGTLVGEAAAIDPGRRPVAIYDVTVPTRLGDEPATVWITLARSRFESASPAEARVVRLTADGWQVLTTSLARANETAAVLRARTPGFSTIAVFPESALQFRWSLPGRPDRSGQRAVVTYREAGVYNVSLTVTDAMDRSDRATHRLLVNDRPEVRIQGPETIGDGDRVTLEADVTDRFGETTVEWRFPDGSTAEGTEVTRSFDRGVHEVEVTVRDSFGATGETRRSLVVGGGPVVEVVEFTLGLEGRVGLVALAALAVLGSLRWLRARRGRRRRRRSR